MFGWVTGMLAAMAGGARRVCRSLTRRITLFELLVLVAIVALLVSILLPAVQHCMFLMERMR